MAFSYRTEPNLAHERVYFTGTDTLYEGYALCKDYDSATAQDPAATTEAVTAWGSGRFQKVEKPATANLPFFAGYVAPSSAGKTGPCWIDIIPHQPQKFINAHVYVSCVVGTTALALQAGQYYLVATFRSDPAAVAVAEQTVDRSGTAGTCQVMMQPSTFGSKTGYTAHTGSGNVTVTGANVATGSSAMVLTLPSTAAGKSFRIVNGGVSHANGLIVDVQGGDKFLGGCGLAALDDGDKYINTLATSAIGDFLEVISDGTDGWYITAVRGTWADGGA